MQGSACDPVQQAWHDLLDALRDAEASFTDGTRGEFDAEEVAAGYRHLTEVMAFATGMYMNVDREWPAFVTMAKDPIGEKSLGEHPDVVYRWAAIRGGRRYRIVGQRGEEAYLSFTVHRGTRGSGSQQFFDGHLNHHDLVTDPDGNFEIVVSDEPAGGNWLQASADANEIYARAYHLDIEQERTASYRIEPLDPTPFHRLHSRDVAERLGEMTTLVRDVTRAIPQPLDDANTAGDLWQPDPNAPSRMWSARDNVYSRGVFRLDADEVLLVEGDVVPCDYWGIQLWSPFLGSGDARRHRVTINTAQARLGPGGEFRVAIARDDPGVPELDWVSTSGERQGTFFVRWMCPERMPTRPTCTLTTRAALQDRASQPRA